MDASELNEADVVYFQAMSIDGFVAKPDGNARWLEEFFIPELGFHGFIARIKAVIIGRKTWDRIEQSDRWPYGNIPGVIASHRPIADIGAPVTLAEGAASAIVAAARATSRGPVWVVGGPDIATQFLEQGALTRIDLFTMPVLLGEGIPAFRNKAPLSLDLISTGTYPKGITRTTWRPRAA